MIFWKLQETSILFHHICHKLWHILFYNFFHQIDQYRFQVNGEVTILTLNKFLFAEKHKTWDESGLNVFRVNVLFLKTSENQRFSEIFKEYIYMKHWVKMGQLLINNGALSAL